MILCAFIVKQKCTLPVTDLLSVAILTCWEIKGPLLFRLLCACSQHLGGEEFRLWDIFQAIKMIGMFNNKRGQ